jgi:uncharacterized membrane protein YqjE
MSPENGNPAEGRSAAGLFASLRNLLETLLAIGQTRLELLSTEVEEELRRTAGILLWALVATLFLAFTVLMLAILVIVASWEDHRVLAAALVTAGFLAITLLAFLILRARARARPRFLSATIEELEKDRRVLGGRR